MRRRWVYMYWRERNFRKEKRSAPKSLSYLLEERMRKRCVYKEDQREFAFAWGHE